MCTLDSYLHPRATLGGLGNPVKLKKVGECRILGELGRGGMATVYRAVHETLQREVAVKELSADGAKNKEALSRFIREAMALAAFRHQHIVTLYDLIEKNDGQYMVMELVDGPTLADLVKEAPLPPLVAALIGLQVASALEHAHFHRLVHRDLKPSNIMLSKWGETKLMDFGIAQAGDLDRLTQTGLAVGTPAYMSPEQASGEEVDGRSDVYSLGVVLYEALAGKKPFTGANAGEVFARLTRGKHVPLRTHDRFIPRRLAAIVARAMRVKKDRRYPDASALRRDLEGFLDEHLDAAPQPFLVAFLLARQKITETEAAARLTQTELKLLRPMERVRPRRWPWMAAAVLGLGAGATAATWALWWPRLAPLVRTLLTP